MEDQELTFGEQLVGIKFNPSDDNDVSKVKQLCAELANIVESNKGSNTYLYNLIKGNSLRELLNAQMNIVKLITLKY